MRDISLRAGFEGNVQPSLAAENNGKLGVLGARTIFYCNIEMEQQKWKDLGSP